MKNPIFVGRQAELEELKQLTTKKSASLVVVQGRRRIGKSRLIEEFAKTYHFFSFSGLPPTENITTQMQRDEFARQLSEQFNIPRLAATDWGELFSFLAKQTQRGRVVILLDEISWMSLGDPSFLGKLKNAWDMQFKKNPQLILTICGSVSSWIEKNILNSTGFVGRVSLVLRLGELKINECNELLEKIGFKGSAYEKFKLLSVMGGVPKYLEEVQPNLTAEENIRHLAFKEGGILFRDFNDIFSDIFSKRAASYKKIVEILVSGEKTYEEILMTKGIKSSGHYSEYLEDLVKSGFVRRDFTWNIKNNKESNLRRYRLSDNYIRFYLKYIDKNKHKIAAGLFEKQSLSNLPGWSGITGLQFENLVLNNRDFIWQKLRIHASDIVSDNPYFQRATTRKKGCQIDYLIQTRLNALFICEVKFSKNLLGPDIIEEVEKKIANLATPKNYSYHPVLIHVNGIHESVEELGLFTQIIDFSLLLSMLDRSLD